MDEQDFAYLLRPPELPHKPPPQRADHAREFYALQEENSGTVAERAAVVADRAALAQKIGARDAA